MTARTLAAIGVAAVVGATVAASLVLMESPGQARLRRIDERRVEDLRELARDIDVFWSRRKALPASLDDLAGEAGLGLRRADPEAGPYGYRVVDATHYELCAEFTITSSGAGAGSATSFWAHGPGRQCFSVAVETDPNQSPRYRF